MIYLITTSDHYYPQSGTSDWQWMGTDKEEAYQYCRMRPSNDLQTRYLISIDLENLTWTEERING